MNRWTPQQQLLTLKVVVALVFALVGGGAQSMGWTWDE